MVMIRVFKIKKKTTTTKGNITKGSKYDTGRDQHKK